MTVALVLPLSQGKVLGIQNFLKAGDQYESLALSVPWLNEYFSQYKRVQVRISFVHGESMGEKAMRVFSTDMHAIGKDALAQEVKANASQVVLLIIGITYYESYWILFPDKHLILWRYGGASGLLKWKPHNFETRPCSEYQGVTGGCVGARVSSAGELMP